ncbi:MAG: DUF5117 domain-containing protein, partial [Vicinamibacterales bacterium]
MRRTLVLPVLLATLAGGSPRAVAGTPAPPLPLTRPSHASGAPAPVDLVARQDPDQAFVDAVQGLHRIPGLFTLYRSADDGRVLMEIAEDQLDRTFLLAATLDRGTGERGVYGSHFMVDYPFMLRRAGHAIQMIRCNTRFTAAERTPQARGILRSFTDAIVGSARIQVGPRPPRRSVLIDASELFVADLPGLTQDLSRAYEPTVYRFDRPGSVIGSIQNFPENTLVRVRLHFTTDNPRASSMTLPDRRSVPLSVAYDLFLIRQNGYRPRRADDRIGHFFAVQQDFTSDTPATTYRRHIARWHLEKADPSAPLSAPKQPIVFWLENTIPLKYRNAIRDGVLMWNAAFERIGFENAIEVRQQPDDADWDPADVRYNTIRWFNTTDAVFAIGPSDSNPFSGQLFNADIAFSEGMTRMIRREHTE